MKKQRKQPTQKGRPSSEQSSQRQKPQQKQSKKNKLASKNKTPQKNGIKQQKFVTHYRVLKEHTPTGAIHIVDALQQAEFCWALTLIWGNSPILTDSVRLGKHASTWSRSGLFGESTRNPVSIFRPALSGLAGGAVAR